MKSIESVQKIIKIGSSSGVTIPARDLKHADIEVGDDVEIIVRKVKKNTADNDEIVNTAKNVLNRYKQDFENLSKR